MKDKKVLAGGAVLILAAFWFFIKPTFLDAAPPVVYTQEQIAAAPRPTLFLGKNPDPHAEGGNEGLVFNLKANPNAPKYARVIIAFEFADPDRHYVGVSGTDAIVAKNVEFAHHLDPEMHKVLDVVTRIFASHSIDEVTTPEGKELLKTELIAQLNEELHGETVEAVYFESFITQ
jgi:flagellar basal body-associated protein FliL